MSRPSFAAATVAGALLIALAVAPAGGGAASPGPSAPAVATGADAPPATELLFAVAAERGTIAAADDGTLLLTLTGPQADAVRYADRPGRGADWMPLDALVGTWPVLFAEEPPNAVLSWAPDRAGGAPGMLVVELGTPSLAADGAALTMPVVATPVSGDDLLAAAWPDRGAPFAFGPATLAIDGASSFVYTVGPLTIAGTPGSDSVSVRVTMNGTTVGQGTLTAASSIAQYRTTVGTTQVDVTLEAEIPARLQTGLLLAIVHLTGGPDGDLDFDGAVGTWPGPMMP